MGACLTARNTKLRRQLWVVANFCITDGRISKYVCLFVCFAVVFNSGLTILILVFPC